ncbi:hypothetical protein BDU57DRAFT_510772 [Ampelomyces quisqualis]|uniref:Uncharacterized protein n=1 Tax=Ampelomyces quisqualis TaxID=50730 RepID=A0A6A5R7C9_AMPQU|nr:hypothetical protein BDU57DRAFT_510772 [Ampelomyces quisqualis]
MGVSVSAVMYTLLPMGLLRGEGAMFEVKINQFPKAARLPAGRAESLLLSHVVRLLSDVWRLCCKRSETNQWKRNLSATCGARARAIPTRP